MMGLGYIIMAALIVAAFGVIIYDRYKYHSYYSRPLVILRVNNERVRGIIEASGIPLCWCTKSSRNNCLMLGDSITVCGFNENIDNIILNAKRKKIKVIDCGVSVKRFIYEIQNLKR